MRRFEIQEMVSQSQRGVTYLALDKNTQREVALRRFFPFGKDKEGLSPEQQSAYGETCQRLMSITHANLRSVVDGGVDPADNTPFMATEWIGGNSLTEILGGGPLDPARAMDVVRAALEVSLALSKAFGEQAVWIDTDPGSIIVGNEESGRGYTFWLCPARWFNTKPKLREAKSIAIMAEELTGWNSRVYTKEAGGGFGGWVKTIKGVPGMTVESALQELDRLVNGEAPASTQSAHATTPASQPSPKPTLKPTPKPVAKPVARPVARPASTPEPSAPTQSLQSALGGTSTQQITPLVEEKNPLKTAIKAVIIVAACLAITAVFGYLVMQNRIKLQEQLAKNEAIERANEEAKRQASNAAGGVEQTAANASTTQQAATKPQNPSGSKPEPKPPTPTKKTRQQFSGAPLFTPAETSELKALGNGKRVALHGTLLSVNKQEQGFINLFFANPQTPEIAKGWATPRNFDGELNASMFEPYIGKEIIISGTYVHEKEWKYPHNVKFTSASQVLASNDQPSPKPKDPTPTKDPTPPKEITPGEVPVLKPGQTKEARELVPGTTFELRGTLAKVETAGAKTTITYTLVFKDAHPNTQIKPVMKVSKTNSTVTAASFQPFIGKEVSIVGDLFLSSSRKNTPSLDIKKLNQIKLAK